MAFKIPTYGLKVQFTSDVTTVDINVPVDFTDLTTGATDWLWDFGDGNTSTLQNPSHTYLSAGNYTVSLFAWNNSSIAGISVINDYMTVISVFDPDALAFITAAGITDPTQQNAINNLVLDLKSASLWDNMDAIYPFVGGTASSNKYNLKDPRDLDAAFRIEFRGTPTFNSDGVVFNPGSYGSTWCVPGTSELNRSFGEYIRLTTNDGWSGSFIGSVFGFKVGTSPNISAIGVNNLIGFGSAISYGYVTTSIVSSSFGYLFNNSTTIYTNTSVDANPPMGVIYIGAMNTGTGGNGSPWGEFSNRTLSFAHLGEGLTPTQHTTFVSIVQDYQTALGRNI